MTGMISTVRADRARGKHVRPRGDPPATHAGAYDVMWLQRVAGNQAVLRALRPRTFVQRRIDIGAATYADESKNLAELMVDDFDSAAAGVTEPFMNGTSLLAGAGGNRLQQQLAQEASAKVALPEVETEDTQKDLQPPTATDEESDENELAVLNRDRYLSWVTEEPVNRFTWRVTVPKAGRWIARGVPVAQLNQLIDSIGETRAQLEAENAAMQKAEQRVRERQQATKPVALEAQIRDARGRAREQVRARIAQDAELAKIDPVVVRATETAISHTIREAVGAMRKREFKNEEDRRNALNGALEEASGNATKKAVAEMPKEEKLQLQKLLGKYEGAIYAAVLSAVKNQDLVEGTIVDTLASTTGKLGAAKKTSNLQFKVPVGTLEIVSAQNETPSLRLHSISHESQHVADHVELILKLFGPWDRYLQEHASRATAVKSDRPGAGKGDLNKGGNFAPGAQRIASELQAEMKKSGDQYHLQNPAGAPPIYRVLNVDLNSGEVVVEMQRHPLLTSGLARPAPQYTWKGKRISS